jgi:DNA-binding NarL/FixJ family response regulator
VVKDSPSDVHRGPTPIRVLLADDHDLVRAGLRTLLRGMGLQVVAEASTGNEALRLTERYKPDVVLMDIAMPDLNGLEATSRLTDEFPSVRVIILSMHANAEYARRALRAGAAGYLLKNSKATELDLAITAVIRGETYLTPAVARFIAEDYLRGSQSKSGSLEGLTPRQLEILQLLVKGYTRKQIADKLTISPKTFDTYRAQLMEQLNIHDVAGLVRYATRMGLVGPDE